MYKLIATAVISTLWIVLSACAVRSPTEPAAEKATQPPTPTQTAPTEIPTQVPSSTPTQAPLKVPSASNGIPIVLTSIREFLATERNVPLDQVTLTAWKPVEWRDACLGVHTKGMMCATVITPGYALKFQVGKDIVGVNTDATGNIYRLVLEAEETDQLPALSWTRTGGIAGICQTLTVYSLGNYYLWDCNQNQLLAQGVLPNDLGGALDANTYLSGLLAGFASFEWQNLPSAGSADMFTEQIRFYGIGSQSLLPEEQQLLSEYLAKLAGALEE